MAGFACRRIRVREGADEVALIVQRGTDDEFHATAFEPNTVWKAIYSPNDWSNLVEEAGASSESEFLQWISSDDSSVSSEIDHSVLKLKFTKLDDDGFYFNFATFSLSVESSKSMWEIICSLVEERSRYQSEALVANENVAAVRSRLDSLEQRVDELSSFCRDRESLLITKFVAILNEKATRHH